MEQKSTRLALRLLKRKRLTLPVLLLASILLIISYHQKDIKNTLVSTQPGQYRVTQVHDGDTISVDMNGVEEKIRMIGVDTPETHDPRKPVQCFGQAATEFTESLLRGKEVRLEADPTNQNRDRYNRLLRYVYSPDGRLINTEIIGEGYGFAYTSFPFEKLEEFRMLQEQARTQNKGLWSSCSPSQNEYGGFNSS
jgi:endonuclease YncB( thermonuclease family)